VSRDCSASKAEPHRREQRLQKIFLLPAHFSPLGRDRPANRISFVIKQTAVLLGILLLRGLREPQRATQPTLTGVFRTVRQLVAAQGASFLGRGG
jgi:hypothetical protein